MPSSEKTDLYTRLTRLPMSQLQEVCFLYGLDERFYPNNPNKVELSKILIQYAESLEHISESYCPDLHHVLEAVLAKHSLHKRKTYWIAGVFSVLLLSFVAFWVWLHLELRHTAQQALDLGDYSKAVAAYDDWLSAVPLDYSARQQRHKAELLQEVFETAEEFNAGDTFERVQTMLEKSPDDAHLLTALANMALNAEQVQPAKNHYQRAVALKPNLARAQYGLGSILLFEGQFAQAETALSAAVALMPWQVEYRSNLATAYLLQDKFAQAQEELRQAQSLDADFLRLSLERAVAYLWQGEVESAEQALQNLTRRLQQSELLEMPKNQASWVFPALAQQQWVVLNEWADKRAYVYRSLSAIGALQNDTRLQQVYAEQADQQMSSRQADIESLVKQDIGKARNALAR